MSDTPSAWELQQRRGERQLKVFQAAMTIKRAVGGKIEVDHIHVATLSAVAEARATMHALLVKGIVTEAEVQDFLDWGYDDLLRQISDGALAKVVEGGHG